MGHYYLDIRNKRFEINIEFSELDSAHIITLSECRKGALIELEEVFAQGDSDIQDVIKELEQDAIKLAKA